MSSVKLVSPSGSITLVPEDIAGTHIVTIPSGGIPAAVKTALNATGTAPTYACRAWVNFNGQGTVAIRASGNVSSITDNGVGNYTVNFATAMPDTNYSVCKANSPRYGATGTDYMSLFAPQRGTGTWTEAAPTTSSFRLPCGYVSDSKYIMANVFR